MIRYRKMNALDQVSSMRNAYLDQLFEAQELYLERRIQQGHAVVLSEKEKLIGYVLLGADKTLLEFYMKPEFQQAIDSLFLQTRHQFDLCTVLCKSYDYTLMSCCLDEAVSVEVLGYSYKQHQFHAGRFDPPWKEVRPAVVSDVKKISAVCHGLFDKCSEVAGAIKKETLWVYTIDDSLLGCGLIQPVILGRPDYDIGVLVHPAHRGKGVGTAIVRHLIRHVESLGGRPVAHCLLANSAFRRTLERAGFVARHRLLSFSLT